MTDFSKMTDKELMDLHKSIEEERSKRKNCILMKSHIKTYIHDELMELFDKRDGAIPKGYLGLSDPYHRVRDAILIICDYTLRNFRTGKRKNTHDPTWTANGPYIYENAENYKALVEDLCKVIKKHFINPEDKDAETS